MKFTTAAALLSMTLMLGTGSSSSARAAEFNASQKQEMEGLIRDYLINHPEIIRDMSQALDKKDKLTEAAQRLEVLKRDGSQVFRNPGDYVAGNPEGDVTIVEFFDYNCSWCKKGFPEVVSLVEQDKKLRFVLKEFPIFGEDSEYAAAAALAAKRQGKYWPFHIAMFSHSGKITKASVDEIAKAQGIDVAKMKKDMNDPAISQTILQNRTLAQTLAINGTPAFIIDDKLIPGYLPGPELAATIAEVRAKGGCTIC